MKKRHFLCMAVVVIFTLMASFGYAADATLTYPVKNEGHKGGDVTPTQAYQMVKEQANVFIVDVRSRPEYVLVCHPTIAWHVPVRFWTGKHTSKGYGMALNEHFSQDLKKRFNPDTDTLIFMCRSGGRSCDAANLAASEAQWPADKIYNMMGGFEGDKVKNEDSIFDGKRMLGGWKNEGLPWTYKVDPKLAYPEAE
jgi:rhodanese-related sulfurtransferase